MELVGTVMSYIDSLIGCAAIVLAVMVHQNHKSVTALLTQNINNTAIQLSEATRSIHKQLKHDIEDIERKVGQYAERQHDEYQLRSACMIQHEHLNACLAKFDTRLERYEEKLQTHTEQILMAVGVGPLEKSSVPPRRKPE